MTKRILQFALMAVFTLCSFSNAALAAGGGKKEVVGIQYMELDPLLLPIINDQGISQQVSLIVKLEFADGEKMAKAEAMKPKIIDAFVQDLYGTLSNKNAMMTNGILRLDKVKTRLKATASKVAGDDLISDVLLQVVQQHRV